jgi:hypothetical protein
MKITNYKSQITNPSLQILACPRFFSLIIRSFGSFRHKIVALLDILTYNTFGGKMEIVLTFDIGNSPKGIYLAFVGDD